MIRMPIQKAGCKSLLILFLLIPTSFLIQCRDTDPVRSITYSLASQPSQDGREEYLDSPYVTAGDRLYMVGHQDGSFPDMGWHVEGEMGGIWNHPIKLMDGFAISIKNRAGEEVRCLDNAVQFVNYPPGNQHIYGVDDSVEIKRSQFVPDGIEGLVIELSIANVSEYEKELVIGFTGMIDLMPVWLSGSLDIEDGTDSAGWEENRQVIFAKDEQNPWFAIFGSNREIDNSSLGQQPCSSERKGQGIDATINNNIRIGAGQTETIQYYIAGSHQSEEKARQQYRDLTVDATGLLRNKVQRYERLKAKSDLSIPDTKIQEMYTWMKYNTDWLIRDVEGMGRGVSAGIPDYPWWFAADNAYTLQGLLATGEFEEVRSTIDLLY